MSGKTMLETEPGLLEHPRIDAFDAFAVWLSRHRAIALPPAEVIVELCAGNEIDPVLGEDEAVGVFLVFDRYAGQLTDEFRVVLALGAESDDDEWIGRMAGMAHELIHVSQFWAAVGSVPSRATPAALAGWNQLFGSGALEDSTEAEARSLAARFIAEQPRWGRAPKAAE